MSGKEVAGGATIAIVVILALMFVGGQYIYPNSRNILLQHNYEEYSSEDWIYEDETTYRLMGDTTMLITIQENSKISAEFSTVANLYLYDDFDTLSHWNISLCVIGVGNRTISIAYQDSNLTIPPLDFLSTTYLVNIQYVTSLLPAGTYNISVFWKATGGSSTNDLLSVCHKPNFQRIRSLLFQEIAG